MTSYLPLFALLLAGGAFVLGHGGTTRVRPGLIGIILIILLLGVAAKMASKFGVPTELGATTIGLVVAMVFVVASEWLNSEAVAVCLGVAVGAIGFRFGAASSVVQFSVLGGGLMAMMIAGSGRMSSIMIVSSAGVIAVNALGKLGLHEPPAVSLGSIIGLFVGAATIFSLFAGKRVWNLPGVLLVVSGGIVLTIHRLLPNEGLIAPALLGLATGTVVTLMVREDEPDALRTGVAVVLWLGLAALTVAISKGLGMSVALLGGLAVPLAMGRTRALLSAGPLIALVLFRLWRARAGSLDNSLDSRDIYAMVGLVFGAVIPPLVEEWRDRVGGSKIGYAEAWGGAVWCLILFGMPWLLNTVISGDAADGFIVGLGFSALAFMNRMTVTARPLATLCGLVAAAVFTDKWTETASELTRAGRIHIITYAAVAIVILALVLAFLLRQKAPAAAQ